jgi:DNA-binding response OmpR family regulator
VKMKPMEPADHILVVDDDAEIRALLGTYLEKNGYRTTVAPDGKAMRAVLARTRVDLVVLDLMLPDANGFDVCRTLRRDSGVPILILSARSDTHDVVAGLEAGADDYVTKPFQVKEITARLRALRRRLRPREEWQDQTSMILAEGPGGPLVLRPGEGRLLRGEEQIHLTLTEFRLLCELADARGQVLSRRQLLQRVWDHDFFGDERLVDVHVRRLRTKIEDDPGRPRVVVTVRGLGYRLEIP